jgi:hypothetical protein
LYWTVSTLNPIAALGKQTLQLWILDRVTNYSTPLQRNNDRNLKLKMQFPYQGSFINWSNGGKTLDGTEKGNAIGILCKPKTTNRISSDIQIQ